MPEPGSGPLAGLRVLELAGMGPGPHAAMVLADLGASVLRVERPAADGHAYPETPTHVGRGRRAVRLDLRTAGGVATVRSLATQADVLIEGMRPGVAERLGVGPADLAGPNPRLVYARMTGWGQDGPWAHTAGHDINYVSVTGALAAIGPSESPCPPLNYLGDYGGGSMMLVTAVLAAIVERATSGRGQTVDVAMLDGVAVLSQQVLGMHTAGEWVDEREANLLDGGAPFYRTYRCSDGRYVAVGAIEPAFYALLLSGLGLDPAGLPDRGDRACWPALRARLAEAFAGRAREHWVAVFAGTDACVTPVLTFAEAVEHPQVAARGSVVRTPDGLVSGRGPRFSRTPTAPVGVAGAVATGSNPVDTRTG